MDKELYDMFIDVIQTGVVSACNIPNETVYSVTSPYYDIEISLVAVYNENLPNNLTVTYILMIDDVAVQTMNDRLLKLDNRKDKALEAVKGLFKLCQTKLFLQLRNSVRSGFVTQLVTGKEYH